MQTIQIGEFNRVDYHDKPVRLSIETTSRFRLILEVQTGPIG